MNVLHVNTFDTGGAARACIRLHSGLLRLGVDSTLLLKGISRKHPFSYEFSPSKNSRAAAKLRRILFEFRLLKDPLRSKKELTQARFLQQLPEGSDYFSFPSSRADITKFSGYAAADIIHLHWVGDFLDYPTFFKKNRKPLVWTLHDMGPFQGGLHYEEKFVGIDENGLPVPRQFSMEEKRVIKNNLSIKLSAFSNAQQRLHIVAPSKWLTDQSAESQLFFRFPHHTIPYGVDENVFALRDKDFARDVLGLSRKAKILLFVADSIQNTRKGFGFLERALAMLSDEDLLLCAVGGAQISLNQKRIYYLGRIDDERLMSLAYAAADIFVIPSLEDNSPNTVIESLMCGTPVVGFPVGGIREMVHDNVNGFLATEISVRSLGNAIEKAVKSLPYFDNRKISDDARQKFNLSRQASDYINLYSAILNGL